MFDDLRYAFRMLMKSPGFTAVAVISLALGIGASTAVFSALDAVLLRSVPVRNAGELRLVNWVGRNPKYAGYQGQLVPGLPGGLTLGTSFSYAAYCTLRDRETGLSDVFAFSESSSVVVRGQDQPARIYAMLVSGNYFSGYGADMLIGRPIVPEDDQPGASPVAVLTYRCWQQQFGLDPRIIGKSITLNRIAFTVIGVLPQHHMSPITVYSGDVYVPITCYALLFPESSLESFDQWQIMGRLAPGADEVQAQAGLSVVFAQSQEISRTKMDDARIVLEDGSRGQLILRRAGAKPFLVLMAVVGVVMLIACANLAGMMLARGAARQHELAVRSAMGAGRWRLIRQSLIESLVLSMTGGGLGLLVAVWGRQALAGFIGSFPDSLHFGLRTDFRVVGFTFGLSVITALIFGMLPAIRASKADPASALRSRSSLGAPRLAVGRLLVTVQVGLSVLLMVGAGLMLRTFSNLARIKPGFDPENVLLFRVSPYGLGYSEQQLSDVYDRIRSAVMSVPGTREATFTDFPLVNFMRSSDEIEVPSSSGEIGPKLEVDCLSVGDGFFGTMGIALLAGRDFSSADRADGPRVAIVNEMFARRHFAGAGAVGRTIRMFNPAQTIEIIGVAGDTKFGATRLKIAPMFYLSQRQRPNWSVHFAVKSVVPPLSLVPAMREAVASVDPNLPIWTVETQQAVVERNFAMERLFAMLFGALAGLAMLLSCIGLYGLMAYSVTRRVPEIGVRMALGATRANIAGPILREALILSITGLGIGVPSAIALTRVIRSRLYGVSPTDPLTLIAAALLLVAVALLAAWIPVRRATRVDPMVALRSE